MQEFRKDFPLLSTSKGSKPLVYLDSAATSQKPQAVIDALTHFYGAEYGTVHRAVYGLAAGATARYDSARLAVQKFLNAAHPEEIIFTKGTTEGLNLIASSFGKAFIKEGDEILICESEHHSNIVPWQLLAKDRGACIKMIPIDDLGEVSLDVIDKQICARTKLIAIAHVANTTGAVHPVKDIAALAHKKGVKVCVDGAQSAAHMPIDVQELGVDFFVFSGHKAYGPTGVGILYGRKELLEAMPPYQGGGDMIERVSFEKTTYQPLPLKFEAGTPMIAEVIALGRAIDYIEAIGRRRIQAWEQQLLEYAIEKLSSLPGVHILGAPRKRASLVSFTIQGVHPLDAATLLDIKGFAVRTGHLCAQPALKRFGHSSVIRISFGLYNTVEEIDLFIEALKDVILELKPI